MNGDAQVLCPLFETMFLSFYDLKFKLKNTQELKTQKIESMYTSNLAIQQEQKE